MPDPTHRDLARASAQWLLAQGWCSASCFELAWVGGTLDAIGCSGPSRDARHQQALERWTRRKASSKKYGHDLEPRPTLGPDTIHVVEAKRTRSDLLADLRREKMLGYQEGATHCSLACWEGCFAKGAGVWTVAGRARVLSDLATMGLPHRWGVLAFYRPRYAATAALALAVLRPATRLRAATREEREQLLEAMAKSYAHRVFRGAFDTSG